MVPTVMVVDDDADIRDMLEEALVDEGYGVCTANNGEHALDVLTAMTARSAPPCVVLLDMMMPKMDGNEFMDATAKIPELADVPIIVVSAAPGKVRQRAGRVVSKPVNLDILLGAIADFCREAPAPKRAR